MICHIHTEMISAKTTYGICLILDPPGDVWVKFVEGGGNASGFRSVYLELSGAEVQLDDGVFLSERTGGWMETELGEFYNNQGKHGSEGFMEYDLIHLFLYNKTTQS